MRPSGAWSTGSGSGCRTVGPSCVTALVVDDDLRPGVASMAKGLWRDALGGGYTANVFAPDALSDLAGGATFNDARVEVSAL